MGKDDIKEETSIETAKKETSLTNADYQRNRLFRKGILYMADEKLEEACRSFETVSYTHLTLPTILLV